MSQVIYNIFICTQFKKAPISSIEGIARGIDYNHPTKSTITHSYIQFTTWIKLSATIVESMLVELMVRQYAWDLDAPDYPNVPLQGQIF